METNIVLNAEVINNTDGASLAEVVEELDGYELTIDLPGGREVTLRLSLPPERQYQKWLGRCE